MEAELLSLLLALTTSPALAGDPPVHGAQPVRMQAPMPASPALPPRHDPLEWMPRPTVLQGSLPGELEITLGVPPGFVVYRDQLHVEVVDGADLHVGPPDIPPGVVRLVPGRDEIAREQYDSDVVVRIPARAAQPEPGVRTVHVRVRHQGCFGGHCFRPQEQVMPVHVPVRVQDAASAQCASDAAEAPTQGAATEPATAAPKRSDSGRHGAPAPYWVVYVYPR